MEGLEGIWVTKLTQNESIHSASASESFNTVIFGDSSGFVYVYDLTNINGTADFQTRNVRFVNKFKAHEKSVTG